jgi:hypothetical protein
MTVQAAPDLVLAGVVLQGERGVVAGDVVRLTGSVLSADTTPDLRSGHLDPAIVRVRARDAVFARTDLEASAIAITPGAGRAAIEVDAASARFARSTLSASGLSTRAAVRLNAHDLDIHRSSIDIDAAGGRAILGVEAGRVQFTRSRVDTPSADVSIRIDADAVVLENRTILRSLGTVDFGAPQAVARRSRIMIDASAVHLDGASRITAAGNVTIRAQDVGLTGRAAIATAQNAGREDGNILVRAGATLALSDRARIVTRPQRLGTEDALAGGGDIELRGRTISLGPTTRVAADADTTRAGDVMVIGRETVRAAGAVVSSEGRSNAAGGDVIVRAPLVELRPGSRLTARSEGQGNAGDIRVRADDLVTDRARVTTEARGADGGDIVIRVRDLLQLRDSRVTATVGGGLGSGGNVNIDPAFVVLEGTRIEANAVDGRGGRIELSTPVLAMSSDSRLQASSAAGPQGVVAVNAPATDVGAAAAPLPDQLPVLASLSREQCETRNGRRQPSRFFVAGRPSTPAEPDGWLWALHELDAGTTGVRGQSTMLAQASPRIEHAFSPCRR